MTCRPDRAYAAQAVAAVALVLACGLAFAGCADRDALKETRMPPTSSSSESSPEEAQDTGAASQSTKALATFGSGCFWCTEAVFSRVRGVSRVTSGYAGGDVDDPDYHLVSTGATGHAEVVQIEFDPAVVSYVRLLQVFFATHDPTTKNRQGADVGTQYRSIVLWHDDAQREAAERVKRELDASGAYDDPIVTEIEPYTGFYAAEDYHQDYFEANPRQPYCQAVIRPKVEKFEKVFQELLKPASPAR